MNSSAGCAYKMQARVWHQLMYYRIRVTTISPASNIIYYHCNVFVHVYSLAKKVMDIRGSLLTLRKKSLKVSTSWMLQRYVW